MGRPRIRAGEVGAIQITQLAKGKIRARARARDDAGVLHQIVAVSAAREEDLISVRNYERLLRSFADDNREALEELGVEVDQYSTHIYRRTTATLVERAAGLTLALRLLGHANEQITRTRHVVSAEEVDPITVDVLDEVLGS